MPEDEMNREDVGELFDPEGVVTRGRTPFPRVTTGENPPPEGTAGLTPINKLPPPPPPAKPTTE